MSKSAPISLPNLPIEVVIRIFGLLDVYDLYAVSHLNKACHAIFKQHLELDFAMKAAGVVNGTREVTAREKLAALARREENWRKLNPSHVLNVNVPHLNSSLYDLSAGFYVLGDSASDFAGRGTYLLRYADLLKCETDAGNNIWGIVEGEGMIADFGLCIDEHDLIALVEVT